jgi:hypothetical protein
MANDLATFIHKEMPRSCWVVTIHVRRNRSLVNQKLLVLNEIPWAKARRRRSIIHETLGRHSLLLGRETIVMITAISSHRNT